MELRIEGTHEEQTAVMKQSIIDLWGCIKGNGKPGLESDIVTVHRALDKIDTALDTSIFWGKVVAGILTLFFVAATAYFTSLEIRGKSKNITPPSIGSSVEKPAYAVRGHAEDAGLPFKIQ